MSSLSPERERTLRLQERTFSFMCGVLNACPRSIPDVVSRELWRQLARAVMGSSGNLEEADEASSSADFVHKMKIALRETKEARRWLKALRVCHLAGHEGMLAFESEAGELSAIFAAIVIKVQARIEREQADKRATRSRKL